jgi:hypothetical protein
VYSNSKARAYLAGSWAPRAAKHSPDEKDVEIGDHAEAPAQVNNFVSTTHSSLIFPRS